MRGDLSSRPDLVGEVRLKVPLVIVIPLTALAVIALIAILFSRVLLNLPKEAAVAIAIVTAANVLGACAYVALRPRMARASVIELFLVALYPILIGVVIAGTGMFTEEGAATVEASGSQGPAPAANEIIAEGLAFQPDGIELSANQKTTYTLTNEDTVVHNLAIYPDERATTDPDRALFTGPDVEGGATQEFAIDALDRGEYPFICDYHPQSMRGTAVIR